LRKYWENRDRFLKMKYQCPHCKSELNDNDVMSSKCSKCLKMFTKALPVDLTNDFQTPVPPNKVSCDTKSNKVDLTEDFETPVARETGKTCPYCQAPIKPGIPVVTCPVCQIPHHQECWNENKGCTTYGCSHQQSLQQTEIQRQPNYQRQMPAENTSGQGPSALIPHEIRRWNWGAFGFSFLWSIFNNVWIGLLVLIPYVGWVMPFVLGAKGNEWAWQNKRWESVEHFQRVQRAWANWFLTIIIISSIIFILIVIAADY